MKLDQVSFYLPGSGATAISVDWSYNVGEAPFGQPSPLSLTADVNFDPESPDVNGQRLWQLGVFAARNADGSGPRRDEITQTLDPFNQAKPLELGGPLEFDNIVTNFPIDDLGCDDYRYVCVEFKKGSNPAPNFKFETQGPGDTIVSCQEHACRGNLLPVFHVGPPSLCKICFLCKAGEHLLYLMSHHLW